MLLTPLQKLPNNVCNLGKIFVATGFECLPKEQKIAQSGHTARGEKTFIILCYESDPRQSFLPWRSVPIFVILFCWHCHTTSHSYLGAVFSVQQTFTKVAFIHTGVFYAVH